MLLMRGFAAPERATAQVLADRRLQAGRDLVDAACMVLGQLGQVAALGAQRVRCLTSEGKIGEEVAHQAARSAPGSPWAAGSVLGANTRAGQPGVVPGRSGVRSLR